MSYLFLSSVPKALDIVMVNKKLKVNQGSRETLMDGYKLIQHQNQKVKKDKECNVLETQNQKQITVSREHEKELPIHINIIVGDRMQTV